MPFRYALEGHDVTETPPGSGLLEIDGFDELFVEDPVGSGLFEPQFALTEGPAGYIHLELIEIEVPPRPPTPPTVALCRGWQRIGTVDAYRLNAAVKDLEPGEWILSAGTAAVTMGKHPTEDRQWMPEEVDTVRLVESGDVLFGGYVRKVSDGVGGVELSLDANGERWTWSGPDLWHALDSRLAFPNPAAASGWAVSHDERSGAPSNVTRDYIDANLGPAALAERQHGEMGTIGSDGFGVAGDWSGRLQPLSELVQRVCRDGGVTARMSVSTDGELTMRVGRPRDLSDRIVFAESDVTSAKIHWVPPSVTWTLAGGQGDGTARVFRIADTGATGADRIEQFLDLSSLSEASELAASAKVNNQLGVEQVTVSAIPTDDAAKRWRPGRDYQVGDFVSVQVRRRRYRVPVVAVVYEVTEKRQLFRPILGDFVQNDLSGHLRDVASLASRFGNQIS